MVTVGTGTGVPVGSVYTNPCMAPGKGVGGTVGKTRVGTPVGACVETSDEKVVVAEFVCAGTSEELFSREGSGFNLLSFIEQLIITMIKRHASPTNPALRIAERTSGLHSWHKMR